ncbi:MAG TPA: succinate dehydrogenase, hydrophobic membrane anchor protein [Anaerolineae bacterium]|nr:succinate dehydrogenase, hydrophobic membrane anchor protein [Anaerolineae bacterium]HID83990.1 succinate dehydrogenase, hydrophobic membrane anchor protein [Anaerolineales bacterium]HIQ09835.1 succinate dehydrogenase, hydrophobic membrane anchor protein [Anaerolineaceae bacterium]
MDRGRKVWVWQAFTGVLLVILLGVHLLANHFLAGGLMTYEQVRAYLANPWVMMLEVIFLVTVTYHALLGVRAVILDLGLSAGAVKRMDTGLLVFGLLIVGYGLWIFSTLL